MKTDTIKLLRECNAGIKMGMNAIDRVLPRAKDPDLRHYLEVARQTHAALGDETHALLLEQESDTNPPHRLLTLMSDVKIGARLACNPSDTAVAHLITDGCNMGIKSIFSYINRYRDASSEAKSVAKRIVASEEYLEEKLRQYL